jgi:glutamine amidotransferase
MITVVDYGASNVPSVLRALRAVGADATVTAEPETVRHAPCVVVPGVGNFAPAMRRLVESGLADAVGEVARAGRPVLGICLGLQLFFESSDEAPGVRGLGLLAGRVKRFATDLPVPHVGWAKVTLTERGREHPALRGAFPGCDAFFYHVHSYHPHGVERSADLADAEYGAPFPTIVGRGNLLGVQFHPEKSQAAGLALLKGFAGWAP